MLHASLSLSAAQPIVPGPEPLHLLVHAVPAHNAVCHAAHSQPPMPLRLQVHLPDDQQLTGTEQQRRDVNVLVVKQSQVKAPSTACEVVLIHTERIHSEGMCGELLWQM